METNVLERKKELEIKSMKKKNRLWETFRQKKTDIRVSKIEDTTNVLQKYKPLNTGKDTPVHQKLNKC